MNKKLYLLGSKIEHSLSPEFYNVYFKEHNLPYQYYLYDTNNIDNFFNEIDITELYAFNVTMPFKVSIIKYLDELDDTAKNINSVNLVKNVNGKLFGYNTDGDGFFNSLLANNILFKNRKITIIGNGGAGKAIYATAKKYNINDIYIISHEISNKLYANADNDLYNEVLDNLSKSELIINTSSAGFMDDKTMPLPKKIIDELIKLNNNFQYIDIIYNPKETEMIKYLKGKGIKNILNGEEMLKHQFLLNLKILFNQD